MLHITQYVCTWQPGSHSRTVTSCVNWTVCEVWFVVTWLFLWVNHFGRLYMIIGVVSVKCPYCALRQIMCIKNLWCYWMVSTLLNTCFYIQNLLWFENFGNQKFTFWLGSYIIKFLIGSYIMECPNAKMISYGALGVGNRVISRIQRDQKYQKLPEMGYFNIIWKHCTQITHILNPFSQCYIH